MLTGKTAFLTGSNRGIGKAILIKFLENGADIICAVRKIDPEFKDFIQLNSKKLKNKIKILEFNLGDEVQMSNAIQSLYKEKITLDILVNNAGIAGGSLFEMTSIKNLKNIFEINFFSQIKLTQLLLRLLKKSKKASIINIGSVSGIDGERGTITYGSSKAALMFATKVMAKEFSVYNIRVNSIAPSATNTDMLNQMDKAAKKKLLENSSLEKPLSVEEVADKVLFLASEKSININGQIIKIDGKEKFEKIK